VLRVNSFGLPKVFEDEAKRIIESLPCLIAGQQNGKTVAEGRPEDIFIKISEDSKNA